LNISTGFANKASKISTGFFINGWILSKFSKTVNVNTGTQTLCSSKEVSSGIYFAELSVDGQVAQIAKLAVIR
jgi:hypothetical protein